MSVSSERMQQWACLVARSRADESFRQQLLADPVPVLKTAGFDLPAGMLVVVVEDDAQEGAIEEEVTLVLNLPSRPAQDTVQ